MESEPATPSKPWTTGKVKHGHVDDLCSNLGYPLVELYGRKGSKFANKANNFRKALTNSAPDFPRCPIDTEDPNALMYAEKFLEQNPDLFQPSAQAHERHWPCLPADKDLIIKFLKKLMCQQEINWRNNNNNYVKNGFKWNHQLQTEAVPKTPTTTKKEPRPKSKKEDEDETHNINVHLEYTFPLDAEASGSSTWLIEPIEYDKMAGKKIIVAENVDPFVLRYLHDRNLYDANNRIAIENFAKDVSRQYPLTALNHEEVAARCTEMVKEFVTAWSPKGGFGFLEKQGNAWHKTAKFASKWASRRQEWLQTVHDGSSDEVIEWFNSTTVHEDAHGLDLKREYVADDDASPASVPTKPKRPRTEGSVIPRVTQEAVEKLIRNYEENPSDTPADRNPHSRSMQSVHRRGGGGRSGRGGRVSAGIPHRAIEEPEDRRSSLPTHVNQPSDMASPYAPTAKRRPSVGHQVASSSFSDLSGHTGRPVERPSITTPQPSTSHQGQSMNHPSPVLPHGHTSHQSQSTAHTNSEPPHTSTSRYNQPATSYPSPQTHASTTQHRKSATPSNQPPASTGHQGQSNTPSRPHASAGRHGHASVIHDHTQGAPTSRPYHSSSSTARSPSTHAEPLNAYAVPTAVAINGSSKDPSAKRMITRELAVVSTIEDQNGASNIGVNPISNANNGPVAIERDPIASQSTPYQYARNSLAREDPSHSPALREQVSQSPAQEAQNTEVGITQQPSFEEPKKVEFFFAIEDRFGDPDDKNAVSQKNMFGMNLTTLFNTVSHKANKRGLELTDISFRCRWAPPRTFVLNRYDGDDKWKKTKDKLQDNFDIAKDRFRQRESFEIWVLCGDMKKEALEATEDGPD